MCRGLVLRLLAAAILLVPACSSPAGWRERAGRPEVESAAAESAAEPREAGEGSGAAPPPAQQSPPVSTRGVGPSFLAFPAGGDSVVARIGDEELRKSQVFDYMLRNYPDDVKASIAVLLGNRVIAAECARHGITVDDGEIDAWYRDHLAGLRRRVALEYGKDATLEQWLRATYGQTPAEYGIAARDRERAKRLFERLVRFEELREDRVALRIISVPDRDLARRIREQLAAGADFATLAKQHSTHPSAENGGLMEPIWRGVLHPELEEVAFALHDREVSDVVTTRDDLGRSRFQILKLVRRIPGRTVSWREARTAVLAGLRERPLTPDEYVMWQLRINRMVRLEDR